MEWGAGLKFSKPREMGDVFFNAVELRGGKLLKSVVSTLLLQFCKYIKLSFVLGTLFPKSTDKPLSKPRKRDLM